ncbi:MAG: 2-C-methyl-D-erythritol 4-phosphate cytidylyltransferase [Bacillota bacterium]|nr:2-C-methyl-D-erythritol 4-phosphate cytidylyltransferase [Bacillota bacterium]
MFCKISATTIKDKKYYYASLVESYRENGKIKHKILKNIGAVDYDTAYRLKLAFSKNISIDQIKGLLNEKK